MCLFISFILLISIQPCYAQTYTSEDYNFKITFPEGWEIKESNIPDDFYITATTKNNNNDIVGAIYIAPKVANFAAEGKTPDDIPEADRQYVIDAMIKGVYTKYPNGRITYSGYQHFGGHGFIVVKDAVPIYGVDYKLTITNTFVGGIVYSIMLISMDEETYADTFSDVLASFSTLY